MRLPALALFLIMFSSVAALACTTTNSAQPTSPVLRGVVADQTGAIVPGAEIDLMDSAGAVDGSFHSGGDGSFQLTAPHTGSYTLVVSEPGFETVHDSGGVRRYDWFSGRFAGGRSWPRRCTSFCPSRRFRPMCG